MTDWTQRKNKSLSSVPLWFEKAIEEYREQEGLQSWSHAIMHLAVFALLRHYSEHENMITFGDKEFEDTMFAELNRREGELGEIVDMYEFWQELIAPPQHGGKREKDTD